MFAFYSNRVGCIGSIVVSLIGTARQRLKLRVLHHGPIYRGPMLGQVNRKAGHALWDAVSVYGGHDARPAKTVHLRIVARR